MAGINYARKQTRISHVFTEVLLLVPGISGGHLNPFIGPPGKWGITEALLSDPGLVGYIALFYFRTMGALNFTPWTSQYTNDTIQDNNVNTLTIQLE